MVFYSIFLVCVPFINGFLLEPSSSSGAGGAGLTDRHYQDLLNLLQDERRSRRQLEDYISVNLQREMEQIKNETITINEKYDSLLVEHTKLQAKLSLIENESGLKSEIRNIHSEFNKTRQDEDQSLMKLETYVRSSFDSMNIKQNGMLLNMSSVLRQINDDKEKVGITACGGFIKGSDKKYIIFPDTRTSYGINNETAQSLTKSGRFTCEKPGLYLIITSIMSFDSYGRYKLYKYDSNSGSVRKTLLGSVVVNPKYSQYYGRDRPDHTGTGSAVVQLNTNDTVGLEIIDIKTTFNIMSCFSVVKLK